MEEAETDLEIVQTDLIVTTIVIEVEEEIKIVSRIVEIVQTVVEETLTADPTTTIVENAEMLTDFVIILVTEAEMIAIVEERLIAATVEKIAIEAGMIVVVKILIVMIVNAMDRILAARGAIEDFGEKKRLPRKNRPYPQQGWTSRWSVQSVDAIRSRS